MATTKTAKASSRDRSRGRTRRGPTNTEDSPRRRVRPAVEVRFVTDHASVQYNETFDQFTTGTKQAIDALEGLAGFLDQAATALEDTDKGLASAIQG